MTGSKRAFDQESFQRNLFPFANKTSHEVIQCDRAFCHATLSP